MTEDRRLDLGPFERVTARLAEALEAFETQQDNLYILDSVVKRFEMTYEQAAKSLRRYFIDRAASTVEIESLTFQELIRRADSEKLLLGAWPEWKDYREARNETAHTYEESKAREIAVEAKLFLKEAQHLLQQLKERIQNND